MVLIYNETWPDCCVEIDYVTVTNAVDETGCDLYVTDNSFGPFVSSKEVYYACTTNIDSIDARTCAKGYKICDNIPIGCQNAVPQHRFRIENGEICGNITSENDGLLCCLEIEPYKLQLAMNKKVSILDNNELINNQKIWGIKFMISVFINVLLISFIAFISMDICALMQPSIKFIKPSNGPRNTNYNKVVPCDQEL